MTLKASHILSSDFKIRDQVVDNVPTLSYQAVCQQTITEVPALENMSQYRTWGGIVAVGKHQEANLSSLSLQ